MSREPSVKTARRLYAVSGNLCAFPRCPTPIVDPESGVIIAEICHIRAFSPGGPRYDASLPEDERNAFENLILLCGVHHKIIDSDVASYPVERLQEMKAAHEEKYKHGAMPSDGSDEIARKLLLTLTVSGSVITTHNQSGGQVAHQITNIYQVPEKPRAVLTPIVEHLLTKVDHQMDLLGYYDFRVSLRNDGPKTVRDFRIEVEIPRQYMEGYGGISAEVTSRTPTTTRLFRHTERELSPVAPYTLYSGETKPVISLHFLVNKTQFLGGISELIKLWVYSDDELVSSADYPIANMLNPEHVELMMR